VLVLVLAAVLSACSASVGVRVAVRASGAGSVTVSVAIPQASAVNIVDLKDGLPVADLRAAGWVVKGPLKAAGTVTVTASHTFSALSQLPTLMADIAGSGPEATRPFRLTVTESPGTLRDRFSAAGRVDLRCSLACFDDARLGRDVGYPLGLAPAEVARLLGPVPGRDLTFQFQLDLPGRVTSAPSLERGRHGALEWVTPLGQSTTISASSQSTNTAAVRRLIVEVALGTVVVVATVCLLVVRGRRRRRRARARARGRKPGGHSGSPPPTEPQPAGSPPGRPRVKVTGPR
jgi:hypothetical protein